MATATDKQTPSTRQIDQHTPYGQSFPRQQTGRLVRRIVTLLVSVTIVFAVGFGSTQFFATSIGEAGLSLPTYEVQRGQLLVVVTGDGNVESASNVNVKCEVAGGSSILWIIQDGEEAKKGDKLVELDSSALEDQINTQKISYSKAKSTLIQAQKNYDLARISVKEYVEGTFKKELQDAETQITIAEENLRSSKDSLEYSESMFQRGYISSLELESQQFAVQRGQLELDSANTAKEVLEKFTKVKTLTELNSTVETAKAALESEQAAFELEEGRLKRLEKQLKSCIIHAPQDGMVVYANEYRGRHVAQQTVTIEEGATVRERQTILRLPDLSQMQVKVDVHESTVEDLRRNMRVRINIQGREFQGTVISIANQPEPSGRFPGNVKEYVTTVKIDGQPEELRPGMTAKAEIPVAHLEDVLTLPFSAIVEQGRQYVCWIKTTEGRIERRPLLLGMSNDKLVEVKDGVTEGDQVIRNPRTVVEQARPELVYHERVDVQARFGGTSPNSSSSSVKVLDGPSTVP